MNRNLRKTCLSWMVICAISLFLLSGCHSIPQPDTANDSNLQQEMDSVTDQEKDTTTNQVDTNSDSTSQAIDSQLASAFTTIENYPLQEDIGAELWLAAQEAVQNAAQGIDTTTTDSSVTSNSPLNDYLSSYTEVITEKGLHYIEESIYFGMTITSEYWVKNGKFKKIEGDKIAIFDGEAYMEYTLSDISGTLSDESNLPSELTQLLEGKLLPYAYLPLAQLESETINGIACEVFYMDMEVMGLKGNTLYVDKETGLVIKQLIGDEDNGMVTTVTQLEVGGFDENLFQMPTDIHLESN